jgi:DNA-directed RNA polymerase specialized sigma24 family protein
MPNNKKQKKITIRTKKSKKNSDNLYGVSEKEFLIVLDNISRRLANKFKFGYHNFDDMKQQAAIFALEGLEKYDHKRPLENFLWTHVRNRLFNYKRNNYQRPDKPCIGCPFYDKAYKCSTSQCSKYTNKRECDLYAAWSSRNDSKKNIMQPSYIADQDGPHRSLVKDELFSNIQNQEIIKFLDQNVQSEYRETYLKLKHGAKIPKQQLTKLQKHIQELLRNQTWNLKDHPENEDN